MGHGVGLFAEVEEGAGYAAGDIEEGEVADFLGGFAQALGHLGADGVEDIGVVLADLVEFGVADFAHFALRFGANPGAAGLLVVK